ncbi:conserved hypothetical protein [Ricinus communis]|uniref:Uncharacterized protein n=1 Tax=Ricinus communis TaxID=3988 RepID=B9T2Q5_RICCO|nr:conserved hypothetical protein [Ricinus communis]
MPILWESMSHCKILLVDAKTNNSQNDELPQAPAAFTLDNSIVDLKWTSDIGALTHMTGSENKKTYNNRDKRVTCMSCLTCKRAFFQLVSNIAQQILEINA